MSKAFYPDEYEQFWRAYDAPPNASKKKAYEAYKNAVDIPNHPLLIQCVEAYKEFLRTNSKPNNPYPKCHPVTWLNQARYEGFLDRAEQLLHEEAKLTERRDASVSASGSTWPESVIKAMKLSEPLLKTWILPCVFKAGPPPVIIAPKRFHADWVANNYGAKLMRILGDDLQITYANK